jgi:hypothetical protein
MGMKRMALGLSVLASMAAATGCDDFSGIVAVEGVVYMADGVTPLPNVEAWLDGEITSGDEPSEIRSTQSFVVGPDGSYRDQLRFDGYDGAAKPRGQILIHGSLGVMIENRLSVYTPDMRRVLTQEILSTCSLSFESRWFAVTEFESKAEDYYVIRQNFVVNVTPADVQAITECQNQVLDELLVGGRAEEAPLQ